MIALDVLTIFVILVIYIIKRSYDHYKFFEKKGIKQIEPTWFFGNALPVLLGKKNFFEMLYEFYKENPKEPLIGCYFFANRFLVIQSPEYAERLLTKDFNHFTDRGIQIYNGPNPKEQRLFFMNATNTWKFVRQKLSPTVTSARLKATFEALIEYRQDFYGHLDEINLTGVDLEEISALLYIDMAGIATFGFNPRVLENPSSKFRMMAKKSTTSGMKEFLTFCAIEQFPVLSKWLDPSLSNPDVTDFFSKFVSEALDRRVTSGEYMDDFLQAVIEMRQKGNTELEKLENEDGHFPAEERMGDGAALIEITNSAFLEQANFFITFGAHFLSLITLYTAFELTQHPEIQEKARQDVREQVTLHSGLTFEALKNMVYLEGIIKESLRMHPVVLMLIRMCTKDYTFPNGYEMKRGERLYIPVQVMHSNPEYFPDPEVFRPERFQGQGKETGFMPFGEGPRMCIARRYSIMQAMLSVAVILLKYRIKLNPATDLPLKLKPSAANYLLENRILFDLEKIE